jgi:ribonuclease VapC
VTVLDASALLAFLQREPGADVVEGALAGGVCGAANWSEVAQKVRQGGGNWSVAREILLSYGLRIEAVTAADGEAAASLWTRRTGLSLGDRLCLALGARLGGEIVTTDTAWAGMANVVLAR